MKNKNKFKHSKEAIFTDLSDPTSVCILINGIIHLKFSKEKYLGLQSWYVSNADFKIEIYLAGNIIKTEYNSLEKWKTVLNIINDQV